MAAGVNAKSTTKTFGHGKISSIVVHSVFVSSSSVALACALIALGTVCHCLGNDPSLGPCPNYLQNLVFGLAGGLLVFGFVLVVWIIRNRKRKLENRALEEFIGNASTASPEREPLSSGSASNGGHGNTDNHMENGRSATAPDNSLNYEYGAEAAVLEEMDRIIQEEKSAGVSYWIEHQDNMPYELPPPPPLELSEDHDHSKSLELEESDRNSCRSEVTAL